MAAPGILRGWSARAELSAGCNNFSSSQLREIALEVVGRLGPFEWIIYSDGTPGGMNHDSGAAAVVTRGSIEQPVRVEVMRRRGRSVASAYEAEVEWLKLAVSWVRDAGLKCHGPVLFCSDCRVITVGLSSPPANED